MTTRLSTSTALGLLLLASACQTSDARGDQQSSVIRQAKVRCPGATTLGDRVVQKGPDPTTVAFCQNRHSGERHGPFWMWFDDDLVLDGEYRNGKMSGTWQSYYRSGPKRWTVEFEAGKPTGTLRAWWLDGTPRIVANYTDGELDGRYRRWFEDGEIALKGQFQNGKRSGRWDVYDPSGTHWVGEIDIKKDDEDWTEKSPLPDSRNAELTMLDKPAIRRVVRRMNRRLYGCLGWAPLPKKENDIRIVETIRIYPNGEVADIRLKKSADKPRAQVYHYCTHINQQFLDFPAIRDGEHVHVNYPFNYGTD